MRGNEAEAMNASDENDKKENSVAGRSFSALAKKWAPLVVLLSLMALAFSQGLHKHLTLSTLIMERQQLITFVDANLAVAVLSYIALYAATVALSFPGASLFTIAGGFPVRLGDRRPGHGFWRDLGRSSSVPDRPFLGRGCADEAGWSLPDTVVRRVPARRLQLSPLPPPDADFPLLAGEHCTCCFSDAFTVVCACHICRHHSRDIRLCLHRVRSRQRYCGPGSGQSWLRVRGHLLGRNRGACHTAVDRSILCPWCREPDPRRLEAFALAIIK
jgi:hypothetical protein